MESVTSDLVERCGRCNVALANEYYRLGHWKLCSECGRRESAQPVHSVGDYGRALIFGSGAAFLGFVAYSAFGILTGFNIGYLAIGVAWFICLAMRKAAPACGGRRFQIAAALLTYSAVSISAIPQAVHEWSKEKHQTVQASAAPGAESRPAEHEPGNIGVATLVLIGVGLASPVLGVFSGNPLNGAIGLFLVFIGVRYAWRTMAARAIEIHGPFALAAGS